MFRDVGSDMSNEANQTRRTRSVILARITSALTIVFALLTAVCLMIPEWSSSGGGPTLITFAWAWQDVPSGIYIDRQFDWPTGEALWVDVPVWIVQVALVAMTGGAVWLHWRVAIRPRHS